MGFTRIISGVALVALLAGCAERERVLTGERIDVRVPLSKSTGIVSDPNSETVVDIQFDPRLNLSLPLSVPAARNYNAWTHTNGAQSHSIANPALAGRISKLWSVSIGKGNDRQQRLTASPVFANGLIYTMDAQARVAAHTTDGRQVWASSLVPEHESVNDASSGGLAYENGILYATTGFGELHALHATSGRSYWVQKFNAPVNLAPTVANGVVYVITRDSRGWAVDAGSGRLRWRWQSADVYASIASGTSPAVWNDLVFLPYPSGEIHAVNTGSGLVVWQTTIGGARGPAARSSLTAISGGPVVADGTLFAANQAGRMAAVDAATGLTRWTVHEGSYSPVWPVGGSVFLVSDAAELVRLDAASGERIWSVELPAFKRARLTSRKAVYANFGPIMAGGRLIVASSNGELRHFDPVSGGLLGTTMLAAGAASSPIVVNGVLYVVSEEGDLIAYR